MREILKWINELCWNYIRQPLLLLIIGKSSIIANVTIAKGASISLNDDKYNLFLNVVAGISPDEMNYKYGGFYPPGTDIFFISTSRNINAHNLNT